MHPTPSIVGLEYNWKMSDLNTSLPLDFDNDHHLRFSYSDTANKHCLEVASQFAQKIDPAFCLLLWCLVSDRVPVLRIDQLH